MRQKVRLDKFLATAGYGSRKDIKKLIRDGTVRVNGQLIRDSATHVSPTEDEVICEGKKVSFREFVYLMLNKPAGCVSATEDTRDTTVVELVPEEYQHYNLFPVGRLDKDTEGLLILTNDGKLAHNLLAPKKHIPKTYFVKVDGTITDEHITAFSNGVVLDDGYKTKPAKMKVISSKNVSEAELTIFEGKFHQVKRMFLSVNRNVLYLKRMSMGELILDPGLSLGEFRELTNQEISLLKNGSVT